MNEEGKKVEHVAGCSSSQGKTSVPGFTLIELLIVMAIIGILASLVLGVSGYVQKKAATSRAESEIAALGAALESYRADYGAYPEGTNTSSSGDNSFLREALEPSTGKVYFEFPNGMLNGSNVVDPFGESYGYQYPGDPDRSGSNFFDLYSRSGTTNTNNWVKNW